MYYILFVCKYTCTSIRNINLEEEMKYMLFNYGFFPINEFISKHTDQKTVYKFFKYCDIAAIFDFHRDLILNAYIFKAQNILCDIRKNYMQKSKWI